MTDDWKKTGMGIRYDPEIVMEVTITKSSIVPFTRIRGDLTIHDVAVEWDLPDDVVAGIRNTFDPTVEFTCVIIYSIDAEEDEIEHMPESDPELDARFKESFESHVREEYGEECNAKIDVKIGWVQQTGGVSFQ